MKKIFALFLLLLAFSATANAQVESKKENPEVLAKNDVIEFSKIIDINTTTNDALYGLFLKKHKNIKTLKETSEEEIKQLSTSIDMKLRASFSDEDIKKLEGVEGLYQRLIFQ
ncbi:hypothetical protein [Flavobacterium sp.]|uniref:hypothetical protein n=1 Tax=Flavobacterium sp. TaxID=239 RepID=UPI00286E17DA|nr:hypothetical protein [Flavobacterium sp.]